MDIRIVAFTLGKMRNHLEGNEQRNDKSFILWDFPGGPVVGTSPSTAGTTGSIPGLGTKIPRAAWKKKKVFY